MEGYLEGEFSGSVSCRPREVMEGHAGQLGIPMHGVMCNYLLRMRNGHGERWSEQAKRRDYRADTGETGGVCPTRSRRQQAGKETSKETGKDAGGEAAERQANETDNEGAVGRSAQGGAYIPAWEDPRVVWRGPLPSMVSC